MTDPNTPDSPENGASGETPQRPLPPQQPPVTPPPAAPGARPVPPAGAPYGQPPQQPPHQPPHQGAPVPPWQNPQQAGAEAQGFFRALFDFSFSQFVTLKFAKFIYVLLIIVLAIGWLAMIITGFAAHPGLGVAALLLGWIPPFISLIFYRMLIEFVVATIRTAQNTSQLVNRR